MTLLDQISGPDDLRDLTPDQLDELAEQIRERVIEAVAVNSGHLGPNLGVVELTIAIHRVFRSPHDKVVFDTGHQSYVHKMLTGRAGQFGMLRRKGGLAGYPQRSESEHDLVENSHASTSLSYADGLAKAYALRGEDRHVVAVIGDGALTGGMAWEALNNIAADETRKLVVVVNDNGRSYMPTVGALARHLTGLRTHPRYEQVLEQVRERLQGVRLVGPAAYDVLHAVKTGLKDAVAPQGMFSDLGLKYVGPVDGHDREAVEAALASAKQYGGPVLVHVLTVKGQGYQIAVDNVQDQMHQSAAFDPLTGDALASVAPGWTAVFRDELVGIGEEREDVVAITAAMLHPTGLDGFAERFPDRCFDVGIAEQHAVTSAAGLAMGGLHPVVAIYATFLNRAFDQVLLDVALHGCGVTFVLDRAGVTGDDGPSHNGMWDLSLMNLVPGLRLAAPRDGARLRELLREAVAVQDAPTVVRFPKGPVFADIAALDRVGGADVVVREGAEDVLVVAVGSMVRTGVEAADKLTAQGVGVTVVDPRWVKPVDPAIVDLASRFRLVVSVEDGGRSGGVGQALVQALADVGATTPVAVHAIAQKFLQHDKRDAICEELGLTADALAQDTLARLAGPAPE
jgi:1-deoxy-D-xylulose-5-phosphate synthase